MSDQGVAIIGAGMAGFGAAQALAAEGVRAQMYDDRARPGGHTSSYASDDGFTFDDGPHISFTENERFRALLEESVGGQFERVRAKVNNHWRGHWIKHPAHANLHGLPTDLVVKCIEDLVALERAPAREIANYADWLLASYGPTFADTFPGAYTRKYHTTGAENLTTDWLGPRLYRGDLAQVLRGALSAETEELHYIDKFRYPSHGGFVSYLGKFLGDAEQHYRHRVAAIDMREKTLSFDNGRTATFKHLIASAPLPQLVPMIAGAPADIVDAAQRLAVTRCVIVNVGVRRQDVSNVHWTYIYDEDVCFTRLSFPPLLSPHTVPPGCGSIQAELYFSDKYRPLETAPADWEAPTIRDLTRIGLLREGEEIVHTSSWATSGNVIFDADRPAALAAVHGYLDDIGIAYCGRYGDWGYMWTDESFLSGERAAQKVLAR